MEPLLPGQTYHIYNHANGEDNLFREEKNYPFFLQKYEKHIAPIAETFAYCLMPNHFHLLLKIRSPQTFPKFNSPQTFPKFETLEKLNDDDEKLSNWLSKQFSNFFSSYTLSYNKVYSRKGSLFLKNFKRKLIASDEQFQSTFLYIHLNPVKHGFTTEVEEWTWSSLQSYLHRDKGNILSLNEAVTRFGSYENIFYCLKEKRQRIMSLNEE